MKKWISAVLIGTILAGMLALPANATDSVILPEGMTHTITIEYDASSVGWQDYDYQDVTIEITFDGYLAEIESYDASAYTEERWYSSDPIYVVEKDSTVTFKIISNDPLASYNYLADVSLPKNGVEILHDGGCAGNGCTAYEVWTPLWPGANAEYPNAVTYMSAGLMPLVVNQVNDTTYGFTPLDGLSSVGFSSTYQLSSTEIADLFDTDSSETGFFGFLYNYKIANILAVDQGDIDELSATGVAVIADEQEVYALTSGSEKVPMAYPGLLEAFGGETATVSDLPYTFSLDYASYNDHGVPIFPDEYVTMEMTFTNTTSQTQSVYAALLFDGYHGYEMHYFSLQLSPNQTVVSAMEAKTYGDAIIESIASGNAIWVMFDSAQELNEIKASMPILAQPVASQSYTCDYIIDPAQSTEWLLETLGYAE